MFVLVYERAGHYLGMTVDKVTKKVLVTDRDKWGHHLIFNTVKEAQAHFEHVLERHENMVQSCIKTAMSNGLKDPEPRLREIYPAPCAPKIYELKEVDA